MARTVLTKTVAKGNYQSAGTAVTMAAADVGNKNSFPLGSNDLVIAQNSGAAPHTVTISSVADPFGRTGDIAAESMAAGEIRVFGPFTGQGWRQSDGSLYLEANHAEIKFGVISLP